MSDFSVLEAQNAENIEGLKILLKPAKILGQVIEIPLCDKTRG